MINIVRVHKKLHAEVNNMTVSDICICCDSMCLLANINIKHIVLLLSEFSIVNRYECEPLRSQII